MTDISGLTIAEQAALGSGATFWTTKAVGPVPALVLTDGPHGVRLQPASSDHLGLGASVEATCFPPAVALSQTWDPDLIERIGAALGDECRALGVHVLLGPGINIKRDPRCGRNFEYYSEDPLLSGTLGSAWVRGVQGRGVGTSLKHFAANNAEHDRMRASSDIDERTLREIYLRAFERVVRSARPWTVMCSYNRINGIHAAENSWLLTTVLREEWGFDGAVISDWGAVADRPAAVAAGLDLEMPATGGVTDAEVVAAVGDGTLAGAAVRRAADRVARLADRVAGSHTAAATFDIDAHHQLARDAACRAIVLLKNDGDLLPLSPSRLAVIGAFAQQPRYQGGGSSHVNPTRLDIPLDEIRRHVGDYALTYCPDTADPIDTCRAAAAADTAVLFLGLTDAEESEGFDREGLDLPAEQLELLRAVVAVQPRTVVVLAHGGVVLLDEVAAAAPAILDGALLGQAGGGALADVLFGVVNPSGRLAETVPMRLPDCPAYLNFPSENGHTCYGERIFVGYRGYDARDLPVAYAFGHGLSYTTFEYTDLTVTAGHDTVTVRLTLTNSGKRAGREVVQVYAAHPGSAISRPPRWLAGYACVTLDPGERRALELEVDRGELAYWDVRSQRWVCEPGEYLLAVGASSRDLRLTGAVHLDGDAATAAFTAESTLGELLADPVGGAVVRRALAEATGTANRDPQAFGTDLMKMLASIPVDRLPALSGGLVTREHIAELLDEVNAQRR